MLPNYFRRSFGYLFKKLFLQSGSVVRIIHTREYPTEISVIVAFISRDIVNKVCVTR